MAIFSLAMIVPAIHATYLGLHRIAQPFFYSALLFFILTTCLCIAVKRPRDRSSPRGALYTILGFYILLPILLAVPLNESLDGSNFLDLYFEMFACLTTTGATIFDSSNLIAEPIHLWRALVGWLGGFIFLVIAFAILEPMSLGGFEIFRSNSESNFATRIIRTKNSEERLLKYSQKLFPIYFVITALIFILMISTGNRAFTSICLAFSTISTSGILPNNTEKFLEVGILSQLIIVIFLTMSLSHTFSTLENLSVFKRLKSEREFRVGVILVFITFLIFTLIDGYNSIGINNSITLSEFFYKMWMRLFSLFSFITTTGFMLEPINEQFLIIPFSVLAVLSLVGGGVATTAGGIKLLRVYTLYKHGANELNKLSHPRSITGFSGTGRDIRKEGAFIAWIFFMLFVLMGASMVLFLSFFGVSLESSVVLTASALSTNGNLAFAAIENFRYQELSFPIKGCLLIGMLVGRFEILAIIAILLPNLNSN